MNNQHREYPPIELLNECFEYLPEEGRLKYKHRPESHFPSTKVYKWWNSRFEGKYADNFVTEQRYRVVIIYSVHYAAHRVIWKMMTGKDAGEFQIDHINQIRDDNRYENLRLATREGNQQNKFTYSNNKTGVKGVRFDIRKKRYVAEIQVNKVNKYVGQFETLEDAAYHVALYRDKYHEEFSNYGDMATVLKDTELDTGVLNELYKHGSKTKVRGVVIRPDIPNTPYMARTTINGKRTILGYYATLEEARSVLEHYRNTGEYTEYNPKWGKNRREIDNN